MHAYLHKVQEKHFKCLLINLKKTTRQNFDFILSRIQKKREGITQKPKSIFYAACDERLSSAAVYYSYFITSVINTQQNMTHPSRVYWRPKFITHYDTHISRDVTPVSSNALRMNF